MRAYKGRGLLGRVLALIGEGWDIRIVGTGAAMPSPPRARVENRFVPETELASLFTWADAVLLTHTEASQSGVAAMAVGAGRYVVSTNVGGLPEQLANAPGAVLCPPEPHALANALQTLPRTPPLRIDAQAAWRDMAASLLAQSRALGLGRAA